MGLVSRTNRFFGQIPSELPEELGNLGNLESFVGAYNILTGSIPSSIFNISTLLRLGLQQNQLSGTLPSITGLSLYSLQELYLHYNRLTGQIPTSITNISQLTILELNRNSLTGEIPGSIGDCLLLEFLSLSNNKFGGSIPDTFGTGCSLKSINLRVNQFGGMLPRSLANCGNLEVLDVQNNKIQDKFPLWMETLLELQVLVLRSNRFNGTLLHPSKTNALFPKLQVFDIGNNSFTGTLPDTYFKSFRAMINVKENITDNDRVKLYSDSVELVIKGSKLEVVRILKTFTTIDMSGNNFYGDIPESMGKLNSLRYLNLSHNDLTGHIPSCIGNMVTLESLDLSSNQLDGDIPTQLTSLTFLAKLNLSMNNLVGQIPQSNQFSTFENDSYVGNQGLCGVPLTRKCEEDSGLEISPEEGYDSDFVDRLTCWQVVAMGYGCGCVIGVSIGYIVLELSFGVAYKIKRRSRGNKVRRRRTRVHK
ncbi:hypothetical protein ACS0TY_028242 [Phlomoides rotata]